MPESPLQVSLKAVDDRPGQFTLTFNASQYAITLKPETSITFSEWLRRLRPVLEGRNDPSESSDPQELLRNVGMWLWRALLPERAPTQEREVLASALRTGRSPLVFALPALLAQLPWELLYDPELSGERGFLARRRALMRLSASATTPAPIEPPLRVLLLISSPPSLGDDSRVDVESERAAVEQATYEMREAGLLHLLVEDIVTPKRVQQVLMRFKPHLVHYIGHGAYSETDGGFLLWEDEQGDEMLLSAERLADLLCPRNLHAVILHACQTGKGNARTDVRSVADTLVKEGIPAVIAQQANFTYESSQRASEALYTALTAGESMVLALFEVRQALTQAESPDWAVPTLQGSSANLMPLLASTTTPRSADPLLTSQGAATDLPTPTGVFVGRHRELRMLHLMLENIPGRGPVMALITGPGGVGKSTVVTQAVTRYGRPYKAALTLHCQGYQGIDLFLQRIGEFLKRLGAAGFLEQFLPDPKLSTEAKIETAITALNAAGPVLLVIDNLESVQNDDQTIRDDALLYLLQKLLTNLRGGRVLITGRYAVKNLLPQGKFAANLQHLNLEDLSSYETNQLVIRHPNLARLGETVRKTLIREFGGLPYVYDLLSKDEKSQSLDRLIHDVQGRITEARKQHTAKEWQEVRQQVIEFAALQATVSRLSLASQVLLAQLSVLHQPFPLAAIEEGLGVVRATWQPLLDWSLLHYDSQEKSYHLHNITRHYAENLLNETDCRQAQVQLATWYEHYAHKESYNLTDYLEAHRLWRDAGFVQQAGELVIQLAEVLFRFGLYPLLRELCTTTLHNLRERDERLTAQVLHVLGVIAQDQGDYDEARRLYGLSRDIKERLGDQSGLAATLHQLGNIAYVQGDYDEAQRLYGLNRDTFRLGDQSGLATTLHQLGMIAQRQGDFDEARRLYGLSRNIKERLGDQRGLANSFGQLGMIAYMQGDYDEARRLYGLNRDTFERLGDQSGLATTLHQLGMIAQKQGDFDEARRLYGLSRDTFERLGDQSGLANSFGQLGNIAYMQGDYDEARRLYGLSWNIKERLGDLSGLATTLHQLGIIAQDQGDFDEAQRLYGLSRDTFERLGDQSGLANSFGQLGKLAYEQQDFEQALKYTIQAYNLFDFLQSPSRTIAQDMISKIRGHMDEATFAACWQTVAGNRPVPILSDEEINQRLIQILIEFIQAPTWDESKRFLESHPELLQPEIDAVLQTFATQQKHDGARKAIEEHRLLLGHCRDNGIEEAYAKHLRTQNPEEDNGLTIEELCDIVSSAILQGTMEQRQQLAANLKQAQQQLSPEGAALGRLLDCFVAALLGETPEVTALEAPFTNIWQAFQNALEAGTSEATE